MSEKEFLKEVSIQSGIPQKTLKDCLDAMKPVALEVLDRGEMLSLRGVFTLIVKERMRTRYYCPKKQEYSQPSFFRYIDIIIHEPIKKFLNRNRSP